MRTYEFQKLYSSLIDFSCAKTAYNSSPLFICIWVNFCIPVSLNDEEVTPWSFLDSVFQLFIEGFDHIVVVV